VTLAVFQGHALNTVDAKSRLSIPAAYRDIIERRTQTRTVVLAPHARGLPCLIGYDIGRTARLEEKLVAQYGIVDSEERENAARALFGTSEAFGYDENGRIILSPDLKDLAEIDRHVFFIAAGDYFEIWNPHVLLRERGNEPVVARMVRRQLEAKGIAA
jgi:MraZ protein